MSYSAEHHSPLHRLVRLMSVVLCSSAVAWLAWTQRAPLTWDAVRQYIAHSFPAISSLSPTLAHQRLFSEQPPVFLDVRTGPEYVCSHIPGAVWAGASNNWRPATPDQAVIVYCSVGWRSARWCKQLQQAGYAHALNLEGGIFSWAHQDLPLQRAGAPVREVHPFDARWGTLLDQALHPTPADE